MKKETLLETAGIALIGGGAIALSPADEIACALTGPLAVICVPLAAVTSPFIGLALIGAGIGTLYVAGKQK